MGLRGPANTNRVQTVCVFTFSIDGFAANRFRLVVSMFLLVLKLSVFPRWFLMWLLSGFAKTSTFSSCVSSLQLFAGYLCLPSPTF